MKCAILQPTYLPWIGYFEMISSVDIFIVFDHVQFVKQSWHQRNRIKTPNGVTMLSLPVKNEKFNTKICDIKISYDNSNQLEKHWRVIEQSYKKSKYFKDYEIIFKEIYSQKHIFLEELNVKIISAICTILEIETKFIYSKDIYIEDYGMDKNLDLINLCKSVGADFIYDAKGAETFLNKEIFTSHGVEIKFQEYEHPIYEQLWGDFVPYMSALDILFNEGPNSMGIIKSGRKIIG